MKRGLRVPSMVMGIGAAIAGAALLASRLRRGGSGSQTNASAAMDDVNLRPRPSTEEVVDAGVQQTFPASDPTAVEGAFETAYEREQRGAGGQAHPDGAPEGAPRSPDWMLRR